MATAVRSAFGRAPSVTLPLRYLLVAAASFVLATAAVPWLAGPLAGHYYSPRVLALAHVVALGWITLTIIGASYQLVPIVLGRALWSERLAGWQLPVVVVGIAGMVGHFYTGHPTGLAWMGALVGAGIVAHLVNVTLTVRGLSRWDFTGALVAAAHGGLALTLLFGLALATARAASIPTGDGLATLHAHVHLALLGWVAPMVIGVAARVYPMFLLAPPPGRWLQQLQLGGLAVGVPGVVIGLLAAPGLLFPAALCVGVALLAHAAWVVDIVRRRRRPQLDWGLTFLLTGIPFLTAAVVVGLALAGGRLAGPRAGLAYAVLGLGGWVSLTIVGMLLKIVPFLVWHHTYAARAGRAPVPTLAQLAWPAAEALAYGLLSGGMAALALAVAAGSATAIRVAGVGLGLGGACLALALAHVLSHLAPGARRVGALPPAPARPR